LQTSPLGANVPIYEPAERRDLQVAGRQFLRPDVKGTYTVMAVTTTMTGGTNTVSTNSLTIIAATYVGRDTCALCHRGGTIAPDKAEYWNTAHAEIFTEGINGLLGHYSESCLACHTAGYDLNTNAVNGGFDDMMVQTG